MGLRADSWECDVRALYRARQFFSSLRPRIDPALRAEAFDLLREPERALFESMMLRDQQHCLDVYHRLRIRGHDDPALLTAALLHDVGKGQISLWHRVVFVLADAATPALIDRLARPGDGRGWRQALYRCRHHGELGATLARRTGASEEVAALIGSTPAESNDMRVVALEAADDAA